MKNDINLIIPHGGYRNLKSYQMSEIVYDATVVFCGRFIERFSRTRDQMIQAARSGKQNIAEGSMASGTSKKTEIRLIAVARASLEELLLGYEDYLRQHDLRLWGKDDPGALEVRRIGFKDDRTYEFYRGSIEDSDATISANTMMCIVHQTNYLLDQLLRHLQRQFLADGGFSERLYSARKEAKKE